MKSKKILEAKRAEQRCPQEELADALEQPGHGRFEPLTSGEMGPHENAKQHQGHKALKNVFAAPDDGAKIFMGNVSEGGRAPGDKGNMCNARGLSPE